MVDFTEWTDAEKWLVAALQSESGEWTPNCLDPEVVLQIAQTAGNRKVSVANSNHLAGCAYCLHAFRQTRELLRLSKSSESNSVTLRDGSHILTFNPDGTPRIDRDLPSGMMRDLIALFKTRRFSVSRSLLPLGALQGAVRSKRPSGKSETESGDSNGDTSFTLLQPIGTLLIEDRPTFRWQPLAEATQYHIAIAYTDPADNNNPAAQVISAEQVNEASWTPSVPLPRGAVLKWEVAALDRQGNELAFAPKPPARAKFGILETSQAAGLENQFHTYADSPLLRGLLAAKAGVLDRAEQAMQELEQANPDNPLAQDLLKSIQTMRSSQP